VTSLREQIEAKQRRTSRLSILVGDAEAAQVEVQTFRAALQVHQEQIKGKSDAARAKGETYEPTEEETAQQERLRADLADAVSRANGTVAVVELQALEPDDWDALFGPVEPGEDGDYDLADIHAAALAASCTDPDLRDEAWWKEQLSRPIWSKGDRAAISAKLLELNVYGPPAAPGKG
jgi:hypothetical protein